MVDDQEQIVLKYCLGQQAVSDKTKPIFEILEDHSGQFKGDIVSSIAESHVLKISHEELVDEFLGLAWMAFGA
jgi:hypothetical protein